MTRINYKSDFDFVLRLTDCRGETIGAPDCNWSAKIWTANPINTFEASRKGEVYINCFPEDGQIHIVCNSHHLGKGMLKMEFHTELPNGIYPDGVQDLYSPQPLGIELVDGEGDCPTAIEVEAMLPYIKGESFTYEDFTPQQIEELQRPATEAVWEFNVFAEKAAQEETGREDAEKVRNNDENKRVVAEKTRDAAEVERRSAETLRIKAENQRQSTEQQRVEAERQRVTEFAGFKEMMDGKQDKLNVSDDFLLDSEARLSLTEKAKRALFDNMWLKAVGKFGAIDHEHIDATGKRTPYMCNELWLTFEEALPILQGYTNRAFESCMGMTVKTIIPRPTVGVVTLGEAFRGTGVINLRFSASSGKVSVFANSMSDLLFSGAPGFSAPLKRLLDEIILFGSGNSSLDRPVSGFRYCPNLEYFRLAGLNNTLYLNNSSKVGIDSIRYCINNRYTGNGSKAFAIVVHPDVYAKLTDPNNAEWHTLLETAVTKNISFALD